jgi:hypothetical protein
VTDMLDFSAEFWENILEFTPPIVDNNSITNGGLTYAANDYCGIDPFGSEWLQTSSEEARAAMAAISSARSGRNQRRKRTQNSKYYLAKN